MELEIKIKKRVLANLIEKADIYDQLDEYGVDNWPGSEDIIPITEKEIEEQIKILADVTYDSKVDTLLHIKRVAQLLTEAASELIKRANCHDDSKLQDPEKALFDEYTPKLKDCTYGSERYQELLSCLKVALDHHYKHNSHHPEHYENGVNGFNLFDLVEMFFDWKAASERHNDGDIYKSIEFNKKRFNLSDQIVDIFTNTAKNLKYEK